MAEAVCAPTNHSLLAMPLMLLVFGLLTLMLHTSGFFEALEFRERWRPIPYKAMSTAEIARQNEREQTETVPLSDALANQVHVEMFYAGAGLTSLSILCLLLQYAVHKRNEALKRIVECAVARLQQTEAPHR